MTNVALNSTIWLAHFFEIYKLAIVGLLLRGQRWKKQERELRREFAIASNLVYRAERGNQRRIRKWMKAKNKIIF